MLAFKFDSAELTGVIAFLRNMNSVDRGSVKPGDAVRGRALFDGQGLHARATASAPRDRGPRLTQRRRREPQRGFAAAVADRSDQPDDADQPAGPRRDP